MNHARPREEKWTKSSWQCPISCSMVGVHAMGKERFKLGQRKRGRLGYERERERVEEAQITNEPCLDGRLVGQEGGGTMGKV